MDAVRDLKLLIAALVIIWVIWFFTGGPSHIRAQRGFFLKPPTPLDTGETYGEFPNLKNKPSNSNNRAMATQNSIFRDEVLIGNISSAKERKINREYIKIKASRTNKNAVRIANWSLKNSTGEIAKIKNAVKLFYSGRINSETPLYLSNRETAIISTGRSPVGVSFQVNKCSKYLEQFQNFYPSFQTLCPSPVNDMAVSEQHFTQECISYVSTLPSCKIYINETPSNLSGACKSYIQNKINYNSCVDIHRNDNDFYKPEWRIFLGKNSELWNNTSDLVRLYDESDNLVGSSSY